MDGIAVITDNLLYEYVRSLCRRLQSLLPNRTGYTIAEVELNPQFVITKNLLDKANSNSPQEDNKDTTFVSNIFDCFCGMLNNINKESNLIKLRDRDEKSLSSTLIILKLLAEIIERNWRLKKAINDLKNEIFSSNCELASNYAIFYHYTPPHPLNPLIVHPTIDTLLSLLSPLVVRKVLTLLRSNQAEGMDLNHFYRNLNSNHSHHYNYAAESTNSNVGTPNGDNDSIGSGNTVAPTGSREFITNYVNDIDNYIEIALKFIAASNPEEYFDYIDAKLFKYSRVGELVPLPALQKYSPLMKHIFYQASVGEKTAREVYKVLPYIKSHYWKLAFMVFFATNIKDQCFSRPEDYQELVTPGCEIELGVRVLFDYIHTVIEESPYSGCSSIVQSWLGVLCVSDFIELENKPNKLRIAFNKRLKFLSTTLKDATSLTNLDSFDSLINIFHLGAALTNTSNFTSEHSLYKFSVTHLDETHENLNRLINKSKNSDLKQLQDNLLINFYIAALMIKPKKYMNILVAKFNESMSDMRQVRILIKTIKGISEFERTTDIFRQLIIKLSGFLKSMIFQLTRFLTLHSHSDEFSTGPRLDDNISAVQSNEERATQGGTLDEDAVIYKANIDSNQSSISNLDRYITELSPSSIMKESVNSIDNIISNMSMDVSTYMQPSFECFTESQLMFNAERMLSDLFGIFIGAPELYFNDAELMNDEHLINTDREEIRKRIRKFAYEVTIPLQLAFQTKSSLEGSILFDSACALTMTLFDRENKISKNYTTISAYSNYLVCINIIQSICEACLHLSLTDAKFKSCFLFLNKFMQAREGYSEIVNENELINNSSSHQGCSNVFHSFEKILLLSLCTHDIQFYNIAKDSMQWYCKEVNSTIHSNERCCPENLSETFEKVINDDAVFTGFVSLHKRFRNILRESKPTKSLYEIWLIIYRRWLEKLESKSTVNDQNLVFRHFTGFLVSTSGCFLQKEFSIDDPEQKLKLQEYISEFFDKCTHLLTSNDLVIRVIIKDALSMESHSAVFHLICIKLMSIAGSYSDKKIANEESILFMEQVLAILATMIGLKNDGAFVLAALLPEVCGFIIDFINLVKNVPDNLRLKLRFCKLGSALESDKKCVGLRGAFKLRNFFAKASAEWLEQAIFFDENTSEESPHSQSFSLDSLVISNKDSENAYLNIDLATECSKCLSLQLEDLLLEIPDGTKDKDIRKNKDLAFANYLSLFYRILQKYTSSELTSKLTKSKYKVNLITDNVLKSISNILQYDTDIGMQFVLPLGYHDNSKIRAIFLNVFANMLAARKRSKSKEEFPDKLLYEMSELYEICSITAEVAPLNEHNLLASSLFQFFGYTKNLDKLFKTLLNDEIDHVSRSSDIFRRNSTLTKLLSNFAKDYGLDYLSETLRPFIQELDSKRVIFEVEKWELGPEDAELFMEYLRKLVDVILSSIDLIPMSFKYICTEIYSCVQEKFENAALIAVGSFIFLRFFCPAIISPEAFFDITVEDVKVKRTLMQLVKVIQNMANGSLGLIKWPSLQSYTDELNIINQRIFDFLKNIITGSLDTYPFQEITEKPIPELRYLHRFFYTYFVKIKHHYILSDPLTNNQNLHHKVETFRQFDKLVKELGQPKALISLAVSSPYKSFDTNNNNSSNQYNEFMAKMSANYIESTVDCPVVHNSIFHDGTPVVVLNFGYLKQMNNDIYLFTYRLFELVSQVWDNKYYLVIDFTSSLLDTQSLSLYVSLLNSYAPVQFFKNCSRIYYFNIPQVESSCILETMRALRLKEHRSNARLYTYSQADSPRIVNSLCLNEETLSISRDNKVVFNEVLFYDKNAEQFVPVTLRIGRQWLQVCFNEYFSFSGPSCATEGFMPIEVYKLSDITRCEVSKSSSGPTDEFIISFNYGTTIILRSQERLEVLKSLYFTTSRIPKQLLSDDRDAVSHEARPFHWFSRLYNITFQGLLSYDEEVKSAAAMLFASLATYFEIDLAIPNSYSTNIAFPSNISDFIVSTSQYLSKRMPMVSHRFFKAFFDHYEKLPNENRLNAILYISPWIDNVCDYIYLENDISGPDRVADIIRQFCRISCLHKEQSAYLNDYIWKKLFNESRLTPILVDEVVAYIIDNKNEGPDWYFIISFISPSVEVCNEVIYRLILCVSKASTTDSAIASQSKLFEIKVLIKICASLFFNSYALGQLFLADVFFFCTLFIDNTALDFGADLQKLFINTIQSFFHKPGLTEKQQTAVDETLSYFSGQRAKMLFGLTRDKNISRSDLSQSYNRATSFEVLCQYLKDFIVELGSSDERSNWKSRWCSYAIDVAFSTTSIFQVRAILVVGILSQDGVNDSTVSRIFKLVCQQPISSLDHLNYLTISCARICEGLSSDSVFPHVMVWPHLCYSLLSYSALYQSSIQCILNSMSKAVLQGPNYLDIIFEQRIYLEPFITEFEHMHNIQIEKSNFEFYTLFTFSHGLRLPHIRHTSLSCIKKYFKLRYSLRSHEEMEELSPLNICLPYLLIIFLSSSDSSFDSYLNEVNFKSENFTYIGNERVPKVILDFMLSGSKSSEVSLIYLAHMFANEAVDTVFKKKFLHLYSYLIKTCKPLGFLIYHIIKSELEHILINSNSTETVNTISEILLLAISDGNYTIERYQHDMNQILESNHITMIRDHILIKQMDDLQTNDGLKLDLNRDVRILQEMMYRSSCIYIEGQKLED
mmetsp:Transcript_6090/g.7475  ORF Transcript_6090/g.7475 Transcript_6090/m.7475 type:complete len:2693 (+) Transcript_6090:217-8295(+)